MTDYTWPADLVPFAQGFMPRSHTGGTQSPFSLDTKTYGLAPARWMCSLTFRGGYDGSSGLTAYGPRLDAMLAKLRGRENRVLIYDFRRMAWRGGAHPTGNSAAAQGATQMTVTGLTPGQPVYDGDYLGGDGRPHIITVPTTADGTGRAIVRFEPPLDLAIAANAAIYGNPPGRFMLIDDGQGDNLVAVGDAVVMSLSFIEDPLPVVFAPAAGALIAPGVFFDSTAGDTFNGAKIDVPADATLTASAAQIVFNSSTDKSLDVRIKDSAGNVLKACFDTMTIAWTCHFNGAFSSTSANGFFTGLINESLGGVYGGQLRAHPGAAGNAYAFLFDNGNQVAFDSIGSVPIGSGLDVAATLTVSGKNITFAYTYPGPDGRTLGDVMGFAVDIHEMPRLMNALGLRFVNANVNVTSLKVSAAYPGARFAFMGDSLTQGRFATAPEDGFAALVRADYPGDVMIAGGPSDQTSDWVTRIRPFLDMAPRTAFVLLGVNDLVNGRGNASIEADYTTIMNDLIDAGIYAVAINVPPIGNFNVPTVNSWLAAQGWPVVDIYSLLVGTGTALSATYDHGDGVHWNDAGHAAVKAAVASFITAQGL